MGQIVSGFAFNLLEYLMVSITRQTPLDLVVVTVYQALMTTLQVEVQVRVAFYQCQLHMIRLRAVQLQADQNREDQSLEGQNQVKVAQRNQNLVVQSLVVQSPVDQSLVEAQIQVKN